MSARLCSVLVFAIAIGATALLVLAQYQVNRQVHAGSYGPSPGSVRYAPQYLGPTSYAPGSTRMLPSEVRNYYSRSGATPSQIRTGYAAIGPSAPGGQASYLQPAPTYGRQAGPAGNRVNPMVASNSAASAGSIRYANSVPANVGLSAGVASPGFTPSVYQAPISMSASPGAVSGASGALPQGYLPTGSVRYSR